MAEDESLRESENAALDNPQIISKVTGDKGKKGKGNFKKGFNASIFITFMICFFLIFIGSGFTIPAAISANTTEAIDVQYVDATRTKTIVAQMALKQGALPRNTAEKLRAKEVLVGDVENGVFVEKTNGKSIKFKDKIISADKFYDEVFSDAELYDAFTEATYNRAAGWYDDDAEDMFKQNGISRNNYYSDKETFAETTEKILGEGNNLTITNGGTSSTNCGNQEKGSSSGENGEAKPEEVPKGNEDQEEAPVNNNEDVPNNSNQIQATTVAYRDWVARLAPEDGNGGDLIIKPQEEENGEEEPEKAKPESGQTETITDEGGGSSEKCEEATDFGGSVDTSSAEAFVRDISEQNRAETGEMATMNATDELTVADLITQEQQSSKFFIAIMENISKMKAGEGNTSKINEVMNYLYDVETVEVVDVETGKKVSVKGSMLESPSLYAILSGDKLSVDSVANYSSERILKTMENKTDGYAGDLTFATTIASSASERATIGRIMQGGSSSDTDALMTIVPTVSSSMVENSFSTIKGVNAGELFVKGATTIGAKLAQKSGGGPGDLEAIMAYQKSSEEVLALDAEVDRMKRSPFDITSKNTFLGSIVYKFAVSSIKSGSLLNKVASFSKVAANSIMSFFPIANADDEKKSFLAEVGECERLEMIFAEGSAQCMRNYTFDTSTYTTEIFNDPVVKKNVTCDADNNCTIKPGSDFDKFQRYYIENQTPIGVVDGAVIEALKGKEATPKCSDKKKNSSTEENKESESEQQTENNEEETPTNNEESTSTSDSGVQLAAYRGLMARLPDDDPEQVLKPHEEEPKEATPTASNDSITDEVEECKEEESGETSVAGFFDIKGLWKGFLEKFFSVFFDMMSSNDEVEQYRRIASKEVFVNTDSEEWNVYKKAQRYFSIVRQRNALRKYDGDETAYSNIPYIGKGDPVATNLAKIRGESVIASE